MDALPKAAREMTGPEKKSKLLAAVQQVQKEIRTTQTLLNTFTPQAKSLIVSKDIEKLMRAAEKVQMGLQELVL